MILDKTVRLLTFPFRQAANKVHTPAPCNRKTLTSFLTQFQSFLFYASVSESEFKNVSTYNFNRVVSFLPNDILFGRFPIINFNRFNKGVNQIIHLIFRLIRIFPNRLKCIIHTVCVHLDIGTVSKHGEVINNVRWGTLETYRYCFDGIPENSIVAIGTCGGSPRKMINRKRFEDGLFEMIKRQNTHTVIVYGLAKYDCIEKLKEPIKIQRRILISPLKNKLQKIYLLSLRDKLF